MAFRNQTLFGRQIRLVDADFGFALFGGIVGTSQMIGTFG